jgi:predicted RNase H-like HicB family nuclease
MVSYVALVHKEKGTSYGVSFPDVPGCISTGDTLEEALANAADALAWHISAMRQDGDPLPETRSRATIQNDKTLSDDISGAAFYEISPKEGA